MMIVCKIRQRYHNEQSLHPVSTTFWIFRIEKFGEILH